MILHNLKRTCLCCPAQWEAKNELGQSVYIRFRFDNLTAHSPCPIIENHNNPDMGPQVFALYGVRDEPYAGAMDTDEMLELTGYTLHCESGVSHD